MNEKLIKILFIVTMLSVLNCKKVDTINAKDSNTKATETPIVDNINYAMIINPNGIPLYSNALDLKSKIDNIPYGAKIIFTLEKINSESEEAASWSSVIFNDKKGFVYSIEPYAAKDWFAMNTTKAYDDKTGKEEPAFGIVKSKNVSLYELPSFDSKIIMGLEQFNLVDVIATGSSYDYFISNNIDLEMGGPENLWYEVSLAGKKGFIFNGINYPVTKSLAEIQLKDKLISERGYFLLTTKKPTLYNADTKEILESKFSINVPKENIFLDTIESRYINGEQTYLINLGSKIDVQLKKKPKNSEEDVVPYNAFISNKDGNYFTEEKFSSYTVANTSFKGDLNAISIVRSEFEKRGIFLNYRDFTLRKISDGKFPQDSYLIASAHVGIYDELYPRNRNIRSIILKQTDGVYEPVSGSIYTSNPIQFKDLDKDGIMEMIVKVPTRGGDETVIYGLKEGKYTSLNTMLGAIGIYEISLKGSKIKGKNWITSEDGKTSKEEIHFFTYEKGSFVEVKK